MLDPRLEGRRALVTGGASGIGRALAVALAHEGVQVLIADRQVADETLQQIEESGGRATATVVDLATEEAVRELAREALDRLGQVDLFVNVAAVARHQPILELTSDAWRETLATNLEPCVWACRELTPAMIARGSGAILVVGSTVAFHPAFTEAAYRASKVALRSLVETAAIELAPHGIRVNMLTPGAFRTPLAARIPAEQLAAVERTVPLGRQGEPAELAPTALLLLSDALSPYTTGAEFVVDGGLHHHPLPHR